MSEDLEVRITVRADDQASGQLGSVRSAVGEMSQTFNAGLTPIQNETRALVARRGELKTQMMHERLFRQSFQQSHEVFFTTTKLIGQVGNVGLKLNSIFLNYNVLQERIANADDKVAEARRRLAAATEKYGTNSKQAKDAQEDLTNAMKAQEKVAREVPGQYLAMSVAAVSVAGDIGLIIQTIATLGFHLRGRGGIGNMVKGFFGGGQGRAAQQLAGSALPFGGASTAMTTAVGTGLGAKIKNFAGSKAGQILIPLGAGVATYEALTETEEGKAINKFNPFRSLGDSVFALTHSREETEQALRNRAIAEGGGNINIGTVNVTASNGATMKSLMQDVDRKTRTSERIGGNSS